MKDASQMTSKSEIRDQGARSKSGERRNNTADTSSRFEGMSRRRKRELDRAAVVIQQWAQKISENLAIQRRLVAIQTTTRRFKQADFDFRMEHDKKFRVEAPVAVIPIQQMIRGYQAMNILRRMKVDKQRGLQNASIVIQSRMRVYLAKTIREKAKRRREYEWQRDLKKYKPEKAKYLEYIGLHRVRLESATGEFEVVKENLSQLEHLREKEHAKMAETMEIQKMVWDDVIRKRIEKEQAKKTLKQEEEQDTDHDVDPNTTPDELEEDNNLMKEWIEKTTAKLQTKEEERKELEKANAEVETMFHELNDFAKKKVAEKKELAGQKIMLANMLVPKAAKGPRKKP